LIFGKYWTLAFYEFKKIIIVSKIIIIIIIIITISPAGHSWLLVAIW
jgi:hypothetical protein